MQLAPTLPYVTNDATLVAPWQRETRFPKIPAWLLSALLLLAFFSFILWHGRHWNSLPYPWLAWLHSDPSIGLPISLLLTIAIKRRGWIRTILALSAIAGVVALGQQVWGFPKYPDFQSFHYSLIMAAARASALLFAGIIWHCKFSWRALAATSRVLVVALSISATDMILEDILQASGSYHHLPKDWWTNIPAESYTLPFVFLFIFWLTLPWTLQPTRNLFRPRREAAFALASLTLLLACIGYYYSGQRVVVRFFFPYHPPDITTQYDRWEEITEEGISDDQIFSMLQRTDWSQHDIHDLNGRLDWRWSAIHRLAKSPENDDHLFTLLRANPSLIPARYIAPTVAADQYYPATLILLRHALFDGDNACINALKTMQLPQVAWARLENFHFIIEVNTTSKIPDFSTEWIATPSEIAPYLDPQKRYSKAECRLIVRREAQGHHAPFPDVICDQADQLVAQFARCIEAEDRAFALYKSTSPPPNNIKYSVGWGGATYPNYDQELLTRIEISLLLGFHPPTGDAASLADLTRQVDQYVAELSRYHGPIPASPK